MGPKEYFDKKPGEKKILRAFINMKMEEKRKREEVE